ncbi:Spy0128 family protein [Olsenella profusa]|uniref:Streptococcal pilin isopeptide linkage domain-containing protein n=1 Tax=Olsenella profusa F0195 TaxID=1125712 RepID=U2TIV4_9ACTN|nr:FctA domain-containing protein [Olsenella profusa]ERL06390.1 hypothetical protein HMPREF1316_1191 [Olsenella profusa F0195]
MGTTTRQLRARDEVLAILGTLAFTFMLALHCAPSRAWAATDAYSEPRTIEVTQSLSKTGAIPAGLDTSFDYELRRMDATAPLPSGAQGDTYAFTMDGDASYEITLSAGTATPTGDLAFSRIGVYTYQLRCVTDASATPGMTVDGTVWEITVAIENDDEGGLKLGWVTVKDLSSGDKLDGVAFDHSFVGGETPQSNPPAGPTILGLRLPQTNDAMWGLIQLSLGICVVGAIALVLGISRRRRERAARHQ